MAMLGIDLNESVVKPNITSLLMPASDPYMSNQIELSGVSGSSTRHHFGPSD
jgi:hypothetical protein